MNPLTHIILFNPADGFAQVVWPLKATNAAGHIEEVIAGLDQNYRKRKAQLDDIRKRSPGKALMAKFKRMIVKYRHGGHDLVSVTLDERGEQVATFDAADWDFLKRLGMSPTLSIGPHGYVYAPAFLSPSAHVNVARALCDAGPGWVIHYIDGDKLNLRKRNLTLRRGPSKHRDRDYLTPADRARSVRHLRPDGSNIAA